MLSEPLGDQHLGFSDKPKPDNKLYPVLDEFINLDLESFSEDSNEDELDEREKLDLEEAAAGYEWDHYEPLGASAPPKPLPPPYAPRRTKVGITAPCGSSLLPSETWRKAALAYPVFEDPNNQTRHHEPVSHKQLKDLVESVRTYGVTASFTIAQIERLAYHAMTPANIAQSFNQNRILLEYLRGNWSQEAEKLSQQLLTQIIALNETRLDPVTLGDLTSTFSSLFSYFKEWVGVFLFGACIFCGFVFCLWLLCKLKRTRARDKVLITQALLALDLGTSPEVWLATFKDS
ncbi:uncharacterized protein LOC116093333 [Mastomys coucha]|uniref:uncharacterized protein LOC116093333 n=1 Tax=Mastomys coucha TaxID=35658 RepID=UPI0012613E92|nr:uncharacterized protein LOC116093333 [Mastomys coucha]